MKLCLAIILIVGSSIPASAVTIDTVTVGDPGNSNDPATGNFFGAVNYSYNMGKYEVTVGQYAAFLNAVAANDKYGLYSVHMATDTRIAGIAKSGTSGNFSYSVIGSPDHPITYVNWADTLRFANWLQNGQPSGVEGPGTTETGAYTLNGVTSGTGLDKVTRNPGVTWFLSTENEWYKAPYYEPATKGGDTDGYWTYAMKTNSVPYSDAPPGTTPDNTRVANFYQDDGVANGYDDGYATREDLSTGIHNYLTDVGAYTSSPSYYGTFDQGGNVYEWNETVAGEFSRIVRGGSYASGWTILRSVDEDYELTSFEGADRGFRVASAVPEPATAAMLLLGMLGWVWRRRR